MNPTVTAKGLRALATGRASILRFAPGVSSPKGDRRVPCPLTGATEIPPNPITAMELIDDACDFERIAAKLERSRR